MADEKVGKKPGEEGGAGVEDTGAESAATEGAEEAGGRHRHHRLLYTCWRDGAANRVHGHWNWFTCWRCGALNYM